ncbi:hypothetical protein [Methylobacterium sp. CM6257]
MDAESSNAVVVERLTAYLMGETLIEFAAAVQRGGATEAKKFLATLEQRFAWALFQVWLETEAGRTRPDLIAAIALRVRELIREEGKFDPRMADAA